MKLNNQYHPVISVAALALALFLAPLAYAQDEAEQLSPLSQINFIYGPDVGVMESQAKIDIPEGFMFAGGDDTRLLMQMMQNLTTGAEVGFMSPDSLDWFMVFEFDESGYVSDEEKDELDADALLKSMQNASEQANAQRRDQGWSELFIRGWEVRPHYDENTNNLVWATLLESKGQVFTNHNTRILGRRGVMSVTLVADQDLLQSLMPEYRNILAGYSYLEGNRYMEFVEGDKIAEYGLTALVLGGGAAMAAKAGLFKWIWKLILPILLAIGAFFKKLFGKGKSNTNRSA